MPNCKDCKLCRLNQLYLLNHDSKKSIFNNSRFNKTTTTTEEEDEQGAKEMSSISDSDRTLRLINLWLWTPSFVLLVVYGAATGQIVLPMGTIPMSISALSTLIHLRSSSSKNNNNNPKPRSSVKSALSFLSDMVLALVFIGLLIPSWVLLDHSWNSGSKILGAYAAVPMMIAFCIHSFFVLRSSLHAWKFPKTRTCPHCNGDLNLKHQRPATTSQHSSGGNSNTSSKESSYHEVADQEAVVGMLEREDYREPRESTDDENERLIVTAIPDE